MADGLSRATSASRVRRAAVQAGLIRLALSTAARRASRLRKLTGAAKPSAPLADEALPVSDEQSGLSAAALDRHLEARSALVVDLDEIHHAPARPLRRH